jgi:hypothetical protein
VIIFKPDNKPVEQFINTATQQVAALVAYDLFPCTETIQAVSCPHPDDYRKNVVFVDTPGFCDLDMEEDDVFTQIAHWLTKA